MSVIDRSMGKKRKRDHGDHVLSGVKLYEYNNNQRFNGNDNGSLVSDASKITSGSRCNYRIQVERDNEQGILASLVLPNRICVLVFNGKKSIGINDNDITLISISYAEGLEEKTKEVTGKKKKNSAYIEAGDTICVISYKIKDDDNVKTYNLCSPIGGHLIETNDKIINNPNLIIDQSNDHGYIAVLFPTYDIVNHVLKGRAIKTNERENNE